LAETTSAFSYNRSPNRIAAQVGLKIKLIVKKFKAGLKIVPKL
jgi:hypothetical protein